MYVVCSGGREGKELKKGTVAVMKNNVIAINDIVTWIDVSPPCHQDTSSSDVFVSNLSLSNNDVKISKLVMARSDSAEP